VDIKLANSGITEVAPKYNLANISSNYQKTPGTAFARCSGVYCHSDGKRSAAYRTYTSILWGSAGIGCNGCHGTDNSTGTPGYASGIGRENSHAKHVGGSADCVKCHFKTTTDGLAVIGGAMPGANRPHLNGTPDVNLIRVSTLTNYSGVYNSGAKTCSTTYCHGGATTSPVWGGTTDCGSCHKADSTLAGAHALHIQAGSPAATDYAAAPGNVSTAGAYRFTCASCHGNTPSNHVNGPVAAGSDATVFFGFSSAGRNPVYSRTGTVNTDANGFKWMAGGAGACKATYCHSNGQGGDGINATFTWASGSGSIGCAGCHDSGGGSTTLSGEHASHTSTYGFTCDICHYETTHNGSSISDKGRHANKVKDVDFSPAIRTTMTNPTWAARRCTNACHDAGSLTW
jgi:predicted CxxxxCH...CXXCH cytochrome family protein